MTRSKRIRNGSFAKLALVAGLFTLLSARTSWALALPTPTPTPTLTYTPTATLTATFISRVCTVGTGSSMTLSARLAVLSFPLRGYQTWEIGFLKPDNTRDLLIRPNRSHFDCSTTSLAGHSTKLCARLDGTQTCREGPNTGTTCMCANPSFACADSIECGLGFLCDQATPSRGVVDCYGGNVFGYDALVQVDHNTNQATVGGQPNTGLPFDPNCTNFFPVPDGSNTVSTACLEGSGANCSGPGSTHTGICNSPTETALSGTYSAGGFAAWETVDLSFTVDADCLSTFCHCGQGTCTGGASPANTHCYSAADCVPPDSCTANNGTSCAANADCAFPGMITQGTCSVCPPDVCPLQDGELAITGQVTSGTSKAVLWQVNDTALIMGTTGAGDGANICGQASGGPVCSTTATGHALPNCIAAPPAPAQLAGTAIALAVPIIDSDYPVGDAIVTMQLSCGEPTNTPTSTPTLTETPTPTDTPTPTLTPALACAVAPRTGCQQPQRASSVTLNAASHIARWRWLGGSTLVALSQFGNPVSGPSAYHLCVYDTNSGPPSLAFAATVPAGGTCGTRPCWKQVGNRFSYTSTAGTPDGIRRVILQASGRGAAQVVVRGRGLNLHLPVPMSGNLLIQEQPQVTVQLQRSDNPACWEALFTRPPVQSTQSGFTDSIR